jgi:hypothetical protein
MIAVPVLTPCGELERSKPPKVLTGVDTLRQPGFQMQKAVDESLHMETVDEPNSSHPKETCPTEKEVPKEN